ncbi:type IV conjugative transfer system coupling protein TraD (plasmid) [Edwardsiella tarda]|uniref:type IV conjugative transfer system coupling protein TraD n=1 Tax=Edwardsiella TaxID=635 RepID=UPI001F01676D|nr:MULTISPECIES: type IV conjugative transfer system coupling protein TraD [Edwardsiella]UJT80791.1 type IV conjugative transfer system coupling protein TraD [Edwardsiella piscicida]WGE31133.1 type IV conjugative transfer system coupling protein TraD [Edwardsiella tarda]
MSFNAKDMTQGGQIASMRFRMFGQIANIIFYCLFLLFWVIAALTLMARLSWQTFVNGCVYWWCQTLAPMRSLLRSQPVYHIEYYGQKLAYNAEQILQDKYTIWCGEQLWSSFVLAAIIGGITCLITFFVASWILGLQGKKQSEDEITGGRQLTDNPKEVAAMLKRDGRQSDIRIEKLPLIKDSEIQNFCLHGTVGTGKSEFYRRLMNHIRQRGDIAIVYDRSCEYVKSYYDPAKDKILNPLDVRCANWDLWRECLTQPDFDNVANTLIPMGSSEDPFWQGSGRTIFAEAAYRMRKDDDRSYAKLVDTLLSIKIDKLRAYLQSSPAANLVEEKIEKTAISIRAVLTNYVKAIRYLQGIERNGESFTIRDWMRSVREDGQNGWLFISSNADTHASLKPVISMWLSIAIRGLLAMGENRQRRVWIFADELPTLHKLPDLVEILPEARKFGGCYVLGFQSYVQLEDIYGVKGAATLFDVLNTRAFFRSPSKQIAEFAAGEIGEKEIQKASEQYSYGADPVRDGVSVGKDMERVTLVSYSDIQTLPDLTCFVTLPGPYPAIKLALKYQPRPRIAQEFIPRVIDTDAEARLSAVLAAREEEGRSIDGLFESDSQADAGVRPSQPTPVDSQPITVAPRHTPATTAAAAAVAAVQGGADTVAAMGGGVERDLQELLPSAQSEQQEAALPPGIDAQGEIVDPDAYAAWQADQSSHALRDKQRLEEVNVNHSHVVSDEELGDGF